MAGQKSNKMLSSNDVKSPGKFIYDIQFEHKKCRQAYSVHYEKPSRYFWKQIRFFFRVELGSKNI